VDANGMPVRAIIAAGPSVDCRQACKLIVGLNAEFFLADKGCDILNQAKQQGVEAVIPAKCNRKQQRSYDKHLYKLRHLVENAFLHLKRCVVL
jgi:transposase